MSDSTLRIRRSITDLQDDYTKGNKKPLEDVMRAWKGIKELPPNDPRSFFMLGGYHGEPFRGAGWGNSSYWGGYCNHGNVLFPTWHRVYLLKLEDALRSIEGCADVALPFWDETSDDSLKNGIPWALTQETFALDGQTIANPLRSFVFTANIADNIGSDDPNYSKPKGYETVRYPLSGLVEPADIAKTKAHNAQFPDPATNVQLLNQNIIAWLTSVIVVDGQVIPTHVEKKFQDCLNAPNYTVFSNTTSAAQWNENIASGAARVVPLESPHNDIHLAVGGFDVPSQGDFSPIGTPTATWARTIPRVSIPFSFSTIASSIACSGCGRRNTAAKTSSRSSTNIPAPTRSTTRARRPASRPIPGSRWLLRSIRSRNWTAARNEPLPRSTASISKSSSAIPTARVRSKRRPRLRHWRPRRAAALRSSASQA
jgi:hypothetical protein